MRPSGKPLALRLLMVSERLTCDALEKELGGVPAWQDSAREAAYCRVVALGNTGASRTVPAT